MSERDVIIKTEGVKVNFGDFWALKGIDIEVKRGEIIVILGPSGSGKSTFIRTLNRLQPHSAGTISVNGIGMNDRTSVSDLKKIRADVGFVFQQFNLFPHLTILENITLAPIKVNGLSKSEAEDKAMAIEKDQALVELKGIHADHLEIVQGELLDIKQELAEQQRINAALKRELGKVQNRTASDHE